MVEFEAGKMRTGPATDFSVPGRGQVHLWLLDLAHHQPESFPLDSMVLDNSEQEKAGRFSAPAGQAQYRLGRTALRNVLSSYHPQVEPRQWRFERNPHGKPFISTPFLPEPLHFNLSHSGRWLVIAVAGTEKVGVDVEIISPTRPLLTLAKRYFTSAEYRELNSQPPESLPTSFFARWTLKEAYSKAQGAALVPILTSLQIALPGSNGIDASLVPAEQNESELPGWHFRLFELGDYWLALALYCEQQQVALPSRIRLIDDPLIPCAASEISLQPCRRSR